MSRQRFRCWMVTIFEEPDYTKWEKIPEIEYIIGQLEQCPTTGKIHWQGYIECTKAMELTTIKKLLTNNTIHLERRLGTQVQAINYVTKSETKIGTTYEYGKKKEQGKRNDLAEAINLLNAGNTINEIIDEIPNMIRYDKHLERYQQRSVEPRNFETEVIVLIGEPGSGKTSHVMNNEKNVWIMPEPSSGTTWFDGYIGQEVALIDDFAGNIRYNFLLQLTDRYPMRVNVKGGYVQWRPKKIYITSNYEIENWYQQDCTALKRRIKQVQRIGTEVDGNTSRPLPVRNL